MSAEIGTLKENSLHASLKEFLLKPGDLIEKNVDRFIVDILRGDTIIEIQTHGFYKLKRKLGKLLDGYKIHLVYPIAKQKWITRQNLQENVVSRRRSPRKGQLLDIFQELMYIPGYLSHPHLTIKALLIEQENILLDDGQGSWRRKGWSLVNQKLIQVYDHVVLDFPEDYANLFTEIDKPFSNKGLASALGCSRKSAQKITYTLKHAGLLQQSGKNGNEILYSLSTPDPGGLI